MVEAKNSWIWFIIWKDSAMKFFRIQFVWGRGPSLLISLFIIFEQICVLQIFADSAF